MDEIYYYHVGAYQPQGDSPSDRALKVEAFTRALASYSFYIKHGGYYILVDQDLPSRRKLFFQVVSIGAKEMEPRTRDIPLKESVLTPFFQPFYIRRIGSFAR